MLIKVKGKGRCYSQVSVNQLSPRGSQRLARERKSIAAPPGKTRRSKRSEASGVTDDERVTWRCGERRREKEREGLKI